MSDLLNSASLVLIPSGYAEDKVYSAVPTDGSGDLSFTRASNGTRINSAGLVEVCPWNLAEQSETFDNVAWVKTTDGQVTISANATTAPNGTLTADKMIASANAGFHCVAQTQSLVAGVFTISIYAKASEYTFLQIFDSLTTDFANFNLTTGAVATVDTYTATIENVGNGWYRCTATKTNPSGNFVFRYGIVTTGTATRGESFTGNGVNGLFIWGAQLNIGSTAKPYFPTTDRLNVPRLTYQNGGGGCPSLLLEKQSTNLVQYSEQFDNAGWTKSDVTISANNTTSPDGTQNADKIISNTTNARHIIYQAFTVGVSTYTFTTYAKAGGNSFLIMRLDTDVPEVKTWFNLSNGTIGTSEGGSPSITSVGNGWYRCSVQFVSSASQVVYAVFYTATTDGNTNFAGNGTDGTFAWGAQLEASSYPTSYIPTTSASATRVADACSKTGISSLIGQTEGVLFVDVDFYSNTGEIGIFIEIGDGSGTNRVLIYYSSTTILCYANASVFSYTQSTSERLKIAFAYKSGNSALYVNGVQKAVSSSALTYSSLSQLNIGSQFSFAQTTFSPTREAILFPTRLTNAELASLTTI